MKLAVVILASSLSVFEAFFIPLGHRLCALKRSDRPCWSEHASKVINSLATTRTYRYDGDSSDLIYVGHITENERRDLGPLLPLLDNILALQERTGVTCYNMDEVDYIAKEHLTYIPRCDLNEGVCQSFEYRLKQRELYVESSFDKRLNPMTVVVGSSGAGRSTFLKHFPVSPEFVEYHKMRQTDACLIQNRVSADPPVVSLVTFDDVKEGQSCALGLRVLHGAIRGMQLLDKRDMSYDQVDDWSNFRRKYRKYQNITLWEARSFVHAAFGKERLILIGVDNIEDSAQDSDFVAHQLAAVQSVDSRIDVVVTATTPRDAYKIISPYRDCKFHVLPPLRNDVVEYATIAKAVLCSLRIKEDSLCGRVLLAAPLLTSGLPRTIQHLVEFAKSKSFVEVLQPYLVRQDSSGLLSALVDLPCFTTSLGAPRTQKECELLLSLETHNPHDQLFNNMLSQNRCMTVDYPSTWCFRSTTSLVNFFRMVKSFRTEPFESLGPLSQAANILFADPYNISIMWQRACALSVFARLQYFRYDGFLPALSYMFHLDFLPECPRVDLVSHIRLLSSTENYSGPAVKEMVVDTTLQRGWDLMLGCVNSHMQPYIAYYKIIGNHSGNVPVAKTIANNLRLTVSEHIAHRTVPCNQVENSSDGECVSISSDEMSENMLEYHIHEELSRIYWVLNMCQAQLEVEDLSALQTEVLQYIEKEGYDASGNTSRKWDLTRRFVEYHFLSNVRVMPASRCKEATLSVVWPILELVSSIEQPGRDS